MKLYLRDIRFTSFVLSPSYSRFTATSARFHKGIKFRESFHGFKFWQRSAGRIHRERCFARLIDRHPRKCLGPTPANRQLEATFRVAGSSLYQQFQSTRQGNDPFELLPSLTPASLQLRIERLGSVLHSCCWNRPGTDSGQSDGIIFSGGWSRAGSGH